MCRSFLQGITCTAFHTSKWFVWSSVSYGHLHRSTQSLAPKMLGIIPTKTRGFQWLTAISTQAEIFKKSVKSLIMPSSILWGIFSSLRLILNCGSITSKSLPAHPKMVKTSRHFWALPSSSGATCDSEILYVTRYRDFNTDLPLLKATTTMMGLLSQNGKTSFFSGLFSLLLANATATIPTFGLRSHHGVIY
jgi:hypothetical protein